jgi:hypothetical protein
VLAHPIERRYNDPASLILNQVFSFPAQMPFVINRYFHSPTPSFSKVLSFLLGPAAMTVGAAA